jgi:hypothetical protein
MDEYERMEEDAVGRLLRSLKRNPGGRAVEVPTKRLRSFSGVVSTVMLRGDGPFSYRICDPLPDMESYPEGSGRIAFAVEPPIAAHLDGAAWPYVLTPSQAMAVAWTRRCPAVVSDLGIDFALPLSDDPAVPAWFAYADLIPALARACQLSEKAENLLITAANRIVWNYAAEHADDHFAAHDGQTILLAMSVAFNAVGGLYCELGLDDRDGIERAFGPVFEAVRAGQEDDDGNCDVSIGEAYGLLGDAIASCVDDVEPTGKVQGCVMYLRAAARAARTCREDNAKPSARNFAVACTGLALLSLARCCPMLAVYAEGHGGLDGMRKPLAFAGLQPIVMDGGPFEVA